MRTSNVDCNFTPREKGVPLNSILNIGSLSKWDQFSSLRALRAFFLLLLFGNIGFLALVSISVLRRRIPELVKFSILNNCQILNYISIWTWALLYCEVGSVSVLESLVSPNNVVSPGGLNALLNKMHLLFSLSRIFLSHSKPTVPF